jgi:hypothetical protein
MNIYKVELDILNLIAGIGSKIEERLFFGKSYLHKNMID